MLSRRVTLRDERIRSEVGRADALFANLEVPLTDRGHPADKAIAFRSPPNLARELAELGIDVVTVANNHALDYGIEGLRQTRRVLEEAGVACVGAGENISEAFEATTLEVAGRQVAFVGMACTLPTGYAASEVRPGLAPVRVMSEFLIDPVTIGEQPGMAPYVRTSALEGDVDRACAAVHRAAGWADIVVVGIHWGVPNGWVAEFQDEIAEYQRPLGRALADAGADLVVGHHPHCLHAIETAGRACILYSTGNFLFHTMSVDNGLALSRAYPPYRLDSLSGRRSRESAMFRAEISGGGISALKVLPVLLDDDGEPQSLAGDEALVVLEDLAKRSGALDTTLQVDGEIGSVTLNASERAVGGRK